MAGSLRQTVQRKAPDGEAPHRSVWRALDVPAAVLDRQGVVLETSGAWAGRVAQGGLYAAVGGNYLDACAAATCATPEAAAVLRQVRDGVAAVLGGGRPAFTVEVPIPPPAGMPAGASCWLEVRVAPLDEAAGGALVRYRDVTDRRLAEERLRACRAQLVHRERVAALGQLAAGVAHEINNPVAFVSSNLRRLSEYAAALIRVAGSGEALAAAVQAGAAEEAQQQAAHFAQLREAEELAYLVDDVPMLVAESLSGLEHVGALVRSMKGFARVDAEEMQAVDLNEGVEAALRIAWHELKYKCEVHKRLSPLPRVRCHPGQLNQVFLNLLVNAAQAIEARGEVTVETTATGEEVAVRISDTGTGIAPEHLPRLFTPFFTTKPAGEGTGLGLSISHDIVAGHGGRIDVESEVGRGTTFTVRLPVAADGEG